KKTKNRAEASKKRPSYAQQRTENTKILENIYRSSPIELARVQQIEPISGGFSVKNTFLSSTVPSKTTEKSPLVHNQSDTQSTNSETSYAKPLLVLEIWQRNHLNLDILLDRLTLSVNQALVEYILDRHLHPPP